MNIRFKEDYIYTKYFTTDSLIKLGVFLEMAN